MSLKKINYAKYFFHQEVFSYLLLIIHKKCSRVYYDS